jgi:hypothetical protein
MDDGTVFLDAADQWLISYAVPPPSPAVKLFEIGHTIELYLKAAHTMMTGDIQRAIDRGHNIKGIWDDCKSMDINFMPSYEIKDSVYKSDFAHNQGKDLSKDDQKHFLLNEEFYFIAKHLADLKYIGAPFKSIVGGYALFITFPNDYWIGFLKELRKYLKHPRPNTLDLIKDCMDGKEIPDASISFLRQLYV